MDIWDSNRDKIDEITRIYILIIKSLKRERYTKKVFSSRLQKRGYIKRYVLVFVFIRIKYIHSLSHL